MSESLDELERRVRAAVERAKAGPVVRRAAPSTKAMTKATHAKLMFQAAHTTIKDVHADQRALIESGADEDDLIDLFKHSLQAYNMLQRANLALMDFAEGEITELRRENRKLRDELGVESEKKAQRREAAAFVKRGAVTITYRAKSFVRAIVRDVKGAFQVELQADEWNCTCRDSDCKHVRPVQLCCFPAVIDQSLGSKTDPASLAAAGAVTIRQHEGTTGGFAEVVVNAKLYTVSRIGAGGLSCTCGAMNAACLHNEAVKFLTGAGA